MYKPLQKAGKLGQLANEFMTEYGNDMFNEEMHVQMIEEEKAREREEIKFQLLKDA